jgi:glycosyltransferase involved in cell wall biosynthesis
VSNKVLIITYYWPPGSGAGVQRWLKFSKYLPSFGWQPVILTVDPDYATYPAIDISLEAEISRDIAVFRTEATDYFKYYRKDKTKVPYAGFAGNYDNSFKGKIFRFIRGNFFIPDPRKGWNKFAFRKACEIIETEGIKHIITTGPPHSTQLIGLKLKKKYPLIKWISDFRDPWTDIYYYELFYPSFIARKIDRNYEKSVLLNADIILTVGYKLGKQLESKVDGIGGKIKIIHNGYDESDFEDIEPVNPETFTISYTGTISESYPVDGFVRAIQKIVANGNKILLRFTGMVSEAQKEQIAASVSIDYLEFNTYTNHRDAIVQMASSSLLLLVIAKHPGNRSFLSGKLFEYIASGRPILCLGPSDGDAAFILKSAGCGKCFSYDDDEGIAEFILSTMNQPSESGKNRPVEYSRRYLTEQMSSLL